MNAASSDRRAPSVHGSRGDNAVVTLEDGAAVEEAFLPMLAIETSQREGSVALLDRSGTIHEEPVASAAEDLVAAIDRLASARAVAPASLRAIAVSIGPGGFTGLRSAVAATKLIAEVTGAIVVAVPSACVIVEACAAELATAEDACVLLSIKAGDERRAGSVWCGRLRRSPDGGARSPWTLDGLHSGLCTVAEVESLLRATPDLAVIGESARMPELAARGWGRLWLEPRWSARSCLVAGVRALRLGVRTSRDALLPLYPREPEAVTIWKLREGRRRQDR